MLYKRTGMSRTWNRFSFVSKACCFQPRILGRGSRTIRTETTQFAGVPATFHFSRVVTGSLKVRIFGEGFPHYHISEGHLDVDFMDPAGFETKMRNAFSWWFNGKVKQSRNSQSLLRASRLSGLPASQQERLANNKQASQKTKTRRVTNRLRGPPIQQQPPSETKERKQKRRKESQKEREKRTQNAKRPTLIRHKTTHKKRTTPHKTT